MLSDEALFEQLSRGDLTAFDALYERYSRHLYGFILRQIADRAEAEDVLHDAFIAVLRERDAGPAKGCFRAWLFQVARHLCLNRLRSRNRAHRAVEAAAHIPQPPALHPEGEILQRQATVTLRAAISRLPGQLAHLFNLEAGLGYGVSGFQLSLMPLLRP